MNSRMPFISSDKRPGISQWGFTLPEVMIAMVLGGIAMGAVMTSFNVQHRTYLAQDQVVEMQQNLRVAMDMMVREIRMAGYDPTGTAGAAIESAISNRIVFTVDWNGNGTLSAGESWEANERLIYGLNTVGTIGRGTGTGSAGLQRVADNVVNLEFYYLLADGTQTLMPADPTQIRGIQITMLAQTAAADHNYTDSTTYYPASWEDQGTEWGPFFNDGFRRRMLTQNVMLRNLGLTP